MHRTLTPLPFIAAMCALVVIVVLLAAPDICRASDAAAPSDRSIQANRAESPPALDGLLDDACWAACAPAEDFFEVSRGCRPTQRTRAMVCYDDEHVYVAFECFEENMDAVSAAVTQRDDGSLFEVDDSVAVLFDTYHDQRSCYAFAANLANTRLDLRVADAGESQEIAWDAVWDVATKRYPDRWTAEFAIPVTELRFNAGESVTWGVEFLRHATTHREDIRWVHYEGEVLDPAHYGDLSGLSLSHSGYGLDVALSAVGRYDEADYHDYPLEPDDAEWDVHPDAGVDLEWVPLPSLTMSGTVNPDFAQIEGDPNEINLTGDELWLEERRPFFAEGMELFQAPLTILYTRRMEDIAYGAKAGGRFGTTNFGALYARSDDFLRTTNAGVVTDEYGNPISVESDYMALVLRQDVFGSANVGGYYAGRERGEDDYSRVGALTFNTPVLEYGRVTAMAARTFNDGDVGEDDAYRMGMEYERSDYRIDGSFEWIGERFIPETGFVSEDRRGRVGGYLEVDRDFQMGGDTVDEIGVDVYGGRYEGIDVTDRDYWYAGSSVATIFQNRLRLSTRVSHTYDEIDYPEHPERTTGIVELTTNLGAWSGYIAGFGFGDYHNSTYYQSHAIACLQPHERLTVDMRVTGVFLRDYEDVDWVVERVRSDWMISRTTFVRLIAQGENVRWGMDGGDLKSQRYDLNLLYGWEFSPGSMFYLAYNQPMERVDGENDFGDPVVVAKVSYLFGL